MKKQFSLNINNPCSEEWNNFTPTTNGKFCQSCSKNVIDFTKMTDQEILNFFSSKPTHTCGRFREDQLKSYHTQASYTSNKNIKWLHAGFLSLLILLTSKQASANSTSPKTEIEFNQKQKKQDVNNTLAPSGYFVSGTVVDEDKKPLSGVIVTQKGNSDSTGAVTNEMGQFIFPKELKEGDTLVFNYMHFYTKEYVVQKNSNEKIEIQITMRTHITVGEVAVNEIYQPKRSGIKLWWGKFKNIF